MFLKHLTVFKPQIYKSNGDNLLRRYCSATRNIKIGNVAFEKTPKSKNPEYVPKKFSKSMIL